MMIDVPAQKIDLREGQILRANHQRQQKIAQHRRNRGDQEKENHGHAVHGEKLVVSFRRDQKTRRGHQVQADHGGEQTAHKKEERHGKQIEQSNAFMVGGKQPRTNAIGGIQIVLARYGVHCGRLRTHAYFFPESGALPAPVAGAGWSFKDLI